MADPEFGTIMALVMVKLVEAADSIISSNLIAVGAVVVEEVVPKEDSSGAVAAMSNISPVDRRRNEAGEDPDDNSEVVGLG